MWGTEFTMAKGFVRLSSLDLSLHYFPTQPGMELTYQVKFGENGSNCSQRIVWPGKIKKLFIFSVVEFRCLTRWTFRAKNLF